MAKPVQSYVQILEQVDRVGHLDADGGGFITRTLYCEPYTSHPFVELFLKGTVVSGDGKGGGTWQRIKPHADPVKPWFYCSDVKVIPFSRSAIKGSRPTGFVPSKTLTVLPTPDANSQQANIVAALNNIDDFDFAANPDVLTPREIAKGTPDYSGDDEKPAFTSKGRCGAFITATYTPVIPVMNWPYRPDNWPGNFAPDDFDFLDLELKPISKTTVIGSVLRIIGRFAGIDGADYGGLSDTGVIVEQLWELTVWRRLVPFLPVQSITRLANHINHNPLVLGDQTFAAGVVRIENPITTLRKRAPDGAVYWDMQLKFTIRTLRAAYYDNTTGTTIQGPIDWNHQAGIPQMFGMNNGAIAGLVGAPTGMNYYPVGFKTDASFWGDNGRMLYLLDDDAKTNAGVSITNLWLKGWVKADGVMS